MERPSAITSLETRNLHRGTHRELGQLGRTRRPPRATLRPVAACPTCRSENRAGARFCDACGSALEASGGRPASRRTVTVLFSDITGSTELGRDMDPEALRTVLGRYYDAMRTWMDRHGASVEKFIGDAVMAVFGIPSVHEDDALRAVRAASEIADVLAPLNDELVRAHGVRIRARTGVD